MKKARNETHFTSLGPCTAHAPLLHPTLLHCFVPLSTLINSPFNLSFLQIKSLTSTVAREELRRYKRWFVSGVQLNALRSQLKKQTDACTASGNLAKECVQYFSHAHFAVATRYLFPSRTRVPTPITARLHNQRQRFRHLTAANVSAPSLCNNEQRRWKVDLYRSWNIERESCQEAIARYMM